MPIVRVPEGYLEASTHSINGNLALDRVYVSLAVLELAKTLLDDGVGVGVAVLESPSVEFDSESNLSIV